jgi:hypothetical protein
MLAEYYYNKLLKFRVEGGELYDKLVSLGKYDEPVLMHPIKMSRYSMMKSNRIVCINLLDCQAFILSDVACDQSKYYIPHVSISAHIED